MATPIVGTWCPAVIATTGASNSSIFSEKATSTARKMVTDYGMTSAVGAVKLGTTENETVLGLSATSRDFSEQVVAGAAGGRGCSEASRRRRGRAALRCAGSHRIWRNPAGAGPVIAGSVGGPSIGHG